MNENDLARRIVAQLDRSLAELPTSTAQKLKAVRAGALAWCCRWRLSLPA
jgi:hypothetical protein